MGADDVAVVIERKVALLTPEVRGSAEQLEELLDPDFEEIGKSGRLWTRGEMIAALVADTDPEQHSINFSDMSGRTVGTGFVLLTYVTQVEGQRARRGSLWRQSMKGWGSCTTRAPQFVDGSASGRGHHSAHVLSAICGASWWSALTGMGLGLAGQFLPPNSDATARRS